jgi:hypothetical protein
VVGRQEAGRGAAVAAGEKLDVLNRELGVEAHRIAAWRDDFLAGGKEALKGRRPLGENG